MQLTVRFSGLCCFVPVPKAGGGLEKVWALLVNARVPDDAPGGPLNVSSHFSFLRFPINLTVPGAPPDCFGLWPLHGCDVTILDGNGNPLGGGISLEQPVLTNPNEPVIPGEEQAFSWIAPLHSGDPKHKRVAGHCIGSASGVEIGKVSTRFDLQFGKLETEYVVRARIANPGPIVKLWFEPPFVTPPDPMVSNRKALGEDVALRATVPTSNLIVSRYNRETHVAEQLVLSQVGGRVDISVLNLEAEGAIEQDFRPPVRKIHDFRWLYLLSADGTAPYPVPVAESALGGNPYCPMARAEV